MTMFIYKPRKREVIFFLIWALVILVTVIGAVTGRVITDFRNLTAQIALCESRLVRLTRILSHADVINTEYKRRITLAEPLRDSGSLIQGIENLARKSGVSLLSLKPTQVKDQGTTDVPALKVEIQDDLPSIIRFFSLINEEISGIGVDRVQIFTRNAGEPPHAAFMITVVTGE